MKHLKCYYVSGASIVFSDEESDSAFITSVLPQGDNYEKKEIVAIIDNEELKGSLFGGKIKSKEIIKKFTGWGANPQDVNKMADFLNSNLNKKESPKEKKKNIKVGVRTPEGTELSADYEQHNKY